MSHQTIAAYVIKALYNVVNAGIMGNGEKMLIR